MCYTCLLATVQTKKLAKWARKSLGALVKQVVDERDQK